MSDPDIDYWDIICEQLKAFTIAPRQSSGATESGGDDQSQQQSSQQCTRTTSKYFKNKYNLPTENPDGLRVNSTSSESLSNKTESQDLDNEEAKPIYFDESESDLIELTKPSPSIDNCYIVIQTRQEA